MIDAPRAVSSDDRDDLERMAGRAYDEALAQRGGPMLASEIGPVGPWLARIETLIDDPEAHLILADFQHVAVGFALAELTTGDAGRPIVDLRFLYTEPEIRGVGVGAALMDALLVWAAAHHATGIDAMVLPGNRAAKNFFEGFGLKARLIRVHSALDDRA